MKDSLPQKPPSWRHQLASVCIGIAAGFTAGWLITAAFSVTTGPWPDIPRLEEAIPIKTAATDLESRPVDLLPTEPAPQPEIVSQQPEIVPASPPVPAAVAEIVPLPCIRPATSAPSGERKTSGADRAAKLLRLFQSSIAARAAEPSSTQHSPSFAGLVPANFAWRMRPSSDSVLGRDKILLVVIVDHAAIGQREVG
jgi:hypothetical protein